MKKIFFVFALNLLLFSSSFPLKIIFDLATLIKDCSGQRILASDTPAEESEFSRSRKYFMGPSRVSLNPTNVLMDACSKFCINFWSSEQDIIKRFYKGKVKEKELLDFFSETEGFIDREIGGTKLFQERRDALGIIQKIFWGLSHEVKVSRGNRESIISFSNCFEKSAGFDILKHIADSYEKHDLYLIGDAPGSWFQRYQEKFQDIFACFLPENIRFSFQVGFTIDELDFHIDFFEHYEKKLDQKNSLLITSNQNLLLLQNCGLNIVFFDPKNPIAVIDRLIREGVLRA